MGWLHGLLHHGKELLAQLFQIHFSPQGRAKGGQGLMKTIAVGNHLFQLTHLGAVNCFFVRENDGVTLVDTSWPSSQARAIMREAEKLGLLIARIVLTHAHIDHVGSLDALHALLPTVRVQIGEREARLLAGDLSLDPSEPQGKTPIAYPCKTQPTQLLHEGDRIRHPEYGQWGIVNLQQRAHPADRTGSSGREPAGHDPSQHQSRTLWAHPLRPGT
jgi:glyoxylase-like metal-dependent hydrolase (beta-lactamase superfamily II)